MPAIWIEWNWKFANEIKKLAWKKFFRSLKSWGQGHFGFYECKREARVKNIGEMKFFFDY